MKATKVTVTGKGNSSVESWDVGIGTEWDDSACKSQTSGVHQDIPESLSI